MFRKFQTIILIVMTLLCTNFSLAAGDAASCVEGVKDEFQTCKELKEKSKSKDTEYNGECDKDDYLQKLCECFSDMMCGPGQIDMGTLFTRLYELESNGIDRLDYEFYTSIGNDVITDLNEQLEREAAYPHSQNFMNATLNGSLSNILQLRTVIAGISDKIMLITNEYYTYQAQFDVVSAERELSEISKEQKELYEKQREALAQNDVDALKEIDEKIRLINSKSLRLQMTIEDKLDIRKQAEGNTRSEEDSRDKAKAASIALYQSQKNYYSFLLTSMPKTLMSPQFEEDLQRNIEATNKNIRKLNNMTSTDYYNGIRDKNPAPVQEEHDSQDKSDINNVSVVDENISETPKKEFIPPQQEKTEEQSKTTKAEPETPVRPDTSAQPDEAKTEPETPKQPEIPVKPDKAEAKPETPRQPKTPSQPDKAEAELKKPAQPETPAQPDKAEAEPQKPAQPETPTQPDKAETKPEIPAQPETPAQPDMEEAEPETPVKGEEETSDGSSSDQEETTDNSTKDNTPKGDNSKDTDKDEQKYEDNKDEETNDKDLKETVSVVKQIYSPNGEPLKDKKGNNVYVYLVYDQSLSGTILYNGESIQVTNNKNAAASSVYITIDGVKWYPTKSNGISAINTLNMYTLD